MGQVHACGSLGLRTTDLCTPRSLVGGQYSKGAPLDRPDGPKVPLVKGQDAPGPEPAREHDHRQVGKVEIQIGVPSIQIERHPIFVESSAGLS